MDVKYIRTITSLRKWGNEIVSRIQRQLNVDRFTASGETGKSLTSETKQSGTILSTEIRSKLLNRGGSQVIQALDQGVSYKHTKPSTTEIAMWMKAKRIRPRSANGRFLSPSDTNLRRAAFAIAKGIGKLGTIARFKNRGSGIMDFVIIPIFPQITSDIRKSLEWDLQGEINKGIPKENLK